MTLRNDILAAIRANPGHSQVELLEVCRLEHKGTLSKIVRRLERLEYVREQEGCYYPSNKTGFPDPVPVSPPAPLSFGPDATPAEMLKENIPLALRKHREFLDLKLDIEDVRGARMQLDAATATMNVAVKLEDIGLRRHEVDILPKIMRRLELERLKMNENLTEQEALDRLGLDVALEAMPPARGRTVEHAPAITIEAEIAINERLRAGQVAEGAVEPEAALEEPPGIAVVEEVSPEPPRRHARPLKGAVDVKELLAAPSPSATPEQTEEQRRVAAAIGFNFTR